MSKVEEMKQNYLTHQNVFNAYVKALNETEVINEYKKFGNL